MSQSLVQIYLHIVFSTKNRQPYLTDRTLRDKVYGYMSGVCKKLGCVEDHAYLLNATLKDTGDFRFYA